jgi:hypothetical protein
LREVIDVIFDATKVGIEKIRDHKNGMLLILLKITNQLHHHQENQMVAVMRE